MHLMFLTRGIISMEEEWKAILRAQRFPFKRKNLETGKEELSFVQGALRPIQFWEYVFPDESLNDILAAMRITGPIERPEIKTATWLLRKMLKLEQIPKNENIAATGYVPQGTLNGKQMPVSPVHNMFVEGIACYPVGIKKDPKKDYDWSNIGQGKYFQEGL